MAAPELGPTPWEENSDWWAKTFTQGADPEYERQIIPLILDHLDGTSRILDLGCGEGQVAREIAECIWEGFESPPQVVVGIDPSPAQLGHKPEEDVSGVQYTRGLAEHLPYRDGAFDGIVCCLVIEHVADADLLLTEVARVLEPGGRFVLLVNHPIFQGPGSGLVDDRILGETYWRVGPYLHNDTVVEEVDPGIEIPFAHRPLSGYVNPCAERGLLLTRMEEPPPLPDLVGFSISGEVECLFPRLLVMRFERY